MTNKAKQLIFIDDSGDPGFKIQKGSSLVAGCIAANHKGRNPELYKIIKKRIESDWEFK